MRAPGMHRAGTTRLRRWAGIAARLGALAATTILLVATSAPAEPFCFDWTAPVAFEARGDCGSGGIVVMKPTGYAEFTILNAQVLGQPPLIAEPVPSEADRVYRSGTHAFFTDYHCPQSFALGAWRIETRLCAEQDGGSSDSGADAANGADGPAPSSSSFCPVIRQCEAAEQRDGQLRLTCVDPRSQEELCTMSLRAIP